MKSLIRLVIVCSVVWVPIAYASPAKELKKELVLDMFNGMVSACDKKDNKLIMEYLSKRIQQSLMKPNHAPLDVALERMCKDVKKIVQTDLGGNLESFRYGIKQIYAVNIKNREAFELCVYKEKEDLQKCHDGLSVIMEDQRLKIDEH